MEIEGLFFIFIYHNISYICSIKYFIDMRKMNRIKEVLEEKGIKQIWLAEKLGKSFSIVNSYVCNRRQPSLELLFEIAEFLQIDPRELISTCNNVKKNK